MPPRTPMPSADDSAVSLVYEITAAIQQEVGMAEGFASQIAEAITRGLRKRLGGTEVYVPKYAARLEKRDRDNQIRGEFNGRNRQALQERFGLSKTQIYDIVKK